jgi:aminoglycoside phosphotransferase (APT) family kinase protein
MLTDALRDAVASGDYSDVAPQLAADVRLETSNEHGGRRIAGRDAVVAHLQRPGPGEVLDWQADEWPTGAAVTFEWRGTGLPERRRWYLRRTGDEVVRWVSYAARARSLPTVGGELPDELLARLGAAARRAELDHVGNSGAALERIVTADGETLIAKRLAPGGDWLGRATNDRGRTALLWNAGAFARMPNAIEHGIVAVEHARGEWWVLMRDLSSTFLGDHRRLSRDESRRILAAAAAMHATFTGEVPAGAATLRDRLNAASPTLAAAERAESDLLPKQFETAWEAFADTVEHDVGDEILAAAHDPAPLARALLRRAEPTLLHGDLRDDNLGLRDDRVILLDWDLATAGTPTVEFAWYLCHDAWRIDATHDQIEADYRAAEVDRLDGQEVELGLISGLVQYGWLFGHSARVHPDPAETAWAAEELAWWVPRVRVALEQTGGTPPAAGNDAAPDGA